MENLKTEEIQREMEKTRCSLTDKLVDLENQVVGTIQSANDAVAGTVQDVKSIVTDAVDSVKDSVQTVKGTVADVTESVKETFDLGARVRENPWMALGASVAAGFMTGMCVFGKSTASPERADAKEAAPTPPMFQPRAARETAREPEKKSWLDDLWQNVEDHLKNMGQAALDQLGDSVVKEVSQLIPGLVESIKTNRRTKRHSHEPAHRNGGSAKGFSRHAG